ncbi:hypothetical protein LOZ80_38015 [Paenibacillus sp. HWE-109]|uniref:hypothetical protein n=1 Tax=Paenibacillus sp. HWE-109 TaxID=1306526 RepID=UPI001EDFEE11|nr:hypothetical protein [Paenibacillus sp. HWE-109]UKS27189.1 hypothetical protein LOZ80_38015 [Paenibacillus sp. HWE-109]
MATEFGSVEYFKEVLLKEKGDYRRSVFVGMMTSILDPETAAGKTPVQILKRARDLVKAYEDVSK